MSFEKCTHFIRFCSIYGSLYYIEKPSLVVSVDAKAIASGDFANISNIEIDVTI
jgi:hypothetical protein